MSIFEAISIQGIRSFDPNKAQVLEFFKPVTIILGQNGSGKTTIIESLKYATTGDFPPGAKVGGSFIHDPKLAQESEIKAKISLEIKDLKGNSLSISRSLKATQKDKNKQISTQTLDSSIKRTLPNGETTSISSKCADINLEMTNSLGVSKAVLENVIFCHQDDSNWPLMEAKSVKQRFDDLFASTRYVKALDSVRKTRIEKDNDIKQYRIELKYLKNARDEAEKKALEKRSLESKIASLNAKIEELKEQLEPTESSILNYQKQISQLNQVESELKVKRNEKVADERRIKELEKNISEPLAYNVQELESMISDSGQELERMKSEIESIEGQISELKTDSKKLQKENNKLLFEKGGLTTHVEAQGVRQEKFNSRLQQLCTELHVDYNQASATRTMKNIHDKISGDEDIMEKTLNVADQEIKNKQNLLDNKVAEKTKLEHDIATNKATLKKKQLELKNLETKIKSINDDADKLTSIDTDLSTLKEDLQLFKESFSAENSNHQIQSFCSEITKLEEQLQKVDTELLAILKLDAKFSEMSSLRQQIIDKTNDAKRRRSRHGENLAKLFENDIPKNNIKKALTEKLTNFRMKSHECQSNMNHWQSQLASLTVEDRQLKSKINEKRELMRKFEESVFKICGNSEFEESFAKLKKRKFDLEEEIATVQGNVSLYKKFLNTLTANGSDCPLCHRDFCDKSEADNLIDEINEKINFSPNLERKANELSVLNVEFEELLKLESQSEEINKLKTFLISSLEKESQEKRNAICAAKSKIEEISKELEAYKQLESTGNAIQGDVALMEKLTEDVKELEKNVVQLEQQTKISPETFKETVSQLQASKSAIQADLSKKKKELGVLRTAYEKSTNKEMRLTTEINNLERKRLQIQAGQQEWSSHCSKKGEINLEINTIELAVQSSNTALDPIVIELSSMRTEIIGMQQRRKATENDLKGKVNNLKIQARDLENILADIKKFETGNIQERLTDLVKKIDKNTEDLKYNSDCVSEMEATIENHKSKISNNRIKCRELDDTLAIRGCQGHIEILNGVIEELIARIGGSNLSTIQAELKAVEATRYALRVEFDDNTTRKNQAVSQIKYIDEDCRDRYVDAEPAYLNMLCKIKVLTIVCSDLDKYYKALDQAIMHHHKSKMTEINKILKELWRNTYSGKDIDYVEICSDEESTVAGSKRRNYNYRVVMVKSGIRLDMRGRCSAGQKVLACLLIRLALAEVFCLHCGVLSLDEPTTNLDQENIENLAYALVKIIKNRSKQKNFQLILITHDEEFLQLLSRSDYVDEFYKIHCNPKGHSEILKTRIDHR